MKLNPKNADDANNADFHGYKSDTTRCIFLNIKI